MTDKELKEALEKHIKEEKKRQLQEKALQDARQSCEDEIESWKEK